MSKSLLIIVTGLPGTGKTTLSKKIAKEFKLPLFSKDYVKASLFDNLGWSDREWSKKVGRAAYSVLYYFVESMLLSGKTFIFESNFKPEFDNKVFLDLKNKYDFESFQIMCETEGKILFERFKERALSKDRHPGHADAENLDEWQPILLQGKIEALNIGGKVFNLDTSDFSKIDYNKLFSAIRLAIRKKQV